jgi:hypothetical protein
MVLCREGSIPSLLVLLANGYLALGKVSPSSFTAENLELFFGGAIPLEGVKDLQGLAENAILTALCTEFVAVLQRNDINSLKELVRSRRKPTASPSDPARGELLMIGAILRQKGKAIDTRKLRQLVSHYKGDDDSNFRALARQCGVPLKDARLIRNLEDQK